ncbi:MAG TPA: LysR family transcriptional regulator [Acetobacteraceae bacterium]|nr:LysR family transcriptional regulator [Acetobacteraceae bacterium]
MPGPRSKESQCATTDDQLSIRIDLADGGRVGPGKIAVLEEIARTGSISAAGRALGMSYRRTWMLVEDLNLAFGKPVVETIAGGAGGGGSRLTEAGEAVVACYRAIEAESALVASKHLKVLNRAFGRK